MLDKVNSQEWYLQGKYFASGKGEYEVDYKNKLPV
jgi:hypothetical protein